MRYLYLSLLCCLVALKSFAQADSSKTTFTLAGVYSNNVSYYGQTIEQKMPYVLTNATVRFPMGIYLSASAYKLLNINESSDVSAAIFGGGYEFNLGKKVTADFSYQYAYYPATSPMLQAANNNNLSAALTYNWWLTNTLSVDYAFGTQSDVFTTFGISKQITLGSLTQSDIITINPSAEFIGGTQHYSNEYTVKKNKGIFKKLGASFLPSNEETVVVQSTNFNFLSYNFKLPLAYNRANYVLEAAYQYSILGNPDIAYSKNSSIFNLSFYYQF